MGALKKPRKEILEAVSLFSRFRIDVLVISPAVEILQRIVQVSERLKLTVHRVSNVSQYEKEFKEIGWPNLIILDLSVVNEKQVALETILALKTMVPHSYYTALVKDGSDAEFCQQLKDAGMNHVQVIDEVLRSMKLDFLLMQQFLLQYYPIELRDLFPGTEITFNAFHFMALNNKYLPVIFERFVLSDKKFKRLEKVSQIYIQSHALQAYQEYIESYYDSFNTGLQKRTKAAFLQLVYAYTQISGLLMNGEGDLNTAKNSEMLAQLLGFCESRHTTLINYIKSSSEPFHNYIQMFQSHGLSSFDRSLFIAGLAAFLSEMSGVGQPGLILKSSLMACSGLMFSDQKTYLKWHDHLESHWSLEDRVHFSDAIKISGEIGRLNLADFKGPMAQIVSHVFERFDGKGLPDKISGEKIPVETSVIQLADGWLRLIAKRPKMTATESYESFQAYLAVEKKSGKINPAVIEKLAQVGFRKT